ncbi:septation protein SepH [Arthrobacter sp. MDT2-16]
MQELRLVGVDGEHLLLSGEEGTSYRLPVDDALRTASTAGASPAPAPPQAAPRQKPAKAPVPLTPRDIQARIRAGATAEQVAAESGLELSHVQRYEGPVRAERDYVAYLAQRVEVATPLPSHDGYRSAFGDNPALLGDMVTFRVRSYGMDPASLEWDSWRRQDGSWHVEASFDLPDGSTVDLGEEPPAQWTYNPTRKTVANGNRWAQVLSELEPLDGPLPSRRLSAVADRVFDFEAEAEEAPETPPADQDGLLDVLRSRRGQRLGADEDGDDALAELLSRGGIPAAHPRNAEGTDDEQEDEDVPVPGLSLAPRTADGDDVLGAAQDATLHEDGTPRLYDGVSTETREISIFAQPARRLQPPAPETQDPGAPAAGRASGRGAAAAASDDSGQDTGGDAAKEAAKDTAKTGTEASAERRPKPKRSSVPSWDDIVFGRKGD